MHLNIVRNGIVILLACDSVFFPFLCCYLRYTRMVARRLIPILLPPLHIITSMRVLLAYIIHSRPLVRVASAV